MDEHQTKIVARFNTKSESGKVFAITVYQDYIITRSLDGSESTILGLRRAVTAEGDHANFIDAVSVLNK
jgi:hypothetical protein